MKPSTKSRATSSELKQLRARAERFLAEDGDLRSMPSQDIVGLVQELQLHQAELEIQTENLREAQQELAAAHDRVLDLYDHAPVGYLTLDHDGRILEANHTAAALLATHRPKLAGALLCSFVAPESQDTFFLHHRAIFEGRIRRGHCELTIRRQAGDDLEVRMQSVATHRESAGRAASICRCALLDTTGEKQARRWRRQAKQLERLVEELPAAAILITANHIHLNQAAETLTGYQQHELTTIDDWFERILAGHSATSLASFNELRRSDHRRYSEPMPISRKNGRQRIVEIAFRQFDEGEVWLLHDLTDRIHAEQSLRENEQRFRQIADNSEDVIWLIDARSRQLLYCSPAFEKIWGLPIEQAMKRPALWRELIHPDDRSGIASFVDRLFTHGTGSHEYRIIRPDGDIRLIRDRGFPIRDESGRLFRLACIAEDITERRQAELDRARLATLLEASPAAIVSITPSGIIREWSPGAQRMFGYTPQEVIGQHVEMMCSPDRKKEIRMIVENIDEGNVLRDFETIRLHKDGTAIPVSINVFNVQDSTGQLIARTAIVQDIRRRRRLERDVTAAAEAERERIGMELHDSLGSSLTAIDCRLTAFARCLEREGMANQSGEALAITRELRQTITDVRELTWNLQRLDDDPGHFIEALAKLTERARHTGLMECRFIAPESPISLPDALTANQMFLITSEAITNALRHSHATELIVQLTTSSGKLILSVSDNGCGIDPATAGKGLGIRTMEYRARLIGGHLSFPASDGGGTRLICVA